MQGSPYSVTCTLLLWNIFYCSVIVSFLRVLCLFSPLDSSTDIHIQRARSAPLALEGIEGGRVGLPPVDTGGCLAGYKL
jgi:hypothetical protein